ncbi:MAG: tyrosine-type recombinase/integrase [Candidatus Melainabacteria bacterium]|nr:tyrosine-type recombinase/integrase [Candidatus Melainabacteria bacterium]
MDTLSIEEVAEDLKLSKRSVLRLARNEKLPTLTKPFPGGFRYIIPLALYLEWKKQSNGKKSQNSSLYDASFVKEQQQEWLEWCKKGLLIGKPLSETTIELYIYCMGLYWKFLPKKNGQHSIISKENLREVFGNLDAKSFSKKDNIYKAIRSFTKYLIAKNYADNELLNELSTLKPRRFYPPKRTHLSIEGFEKLLEFAGNKRNGQREYDRMLTIATISTIGFTGLRASELCNLRLQDLDLNNRRLFIYLGKGRKNRYVGICNRLHECLTKYLQVRPKTNLENLFVSIDYQTKTPVAFNKSTLGKKIRRLAKRVGVEVSAHGLRRTFATVAANAGKPINIISLALGHSDLKTTQGYLMTSQDEVIKEMQGW